MDEQCAKACPWEDKFYINRDSKSIQATKARSPVRI